MEREQRKPSRKTTRHKTRRVSRSMRPSPDKYGGLPESDELQTLPLRSVSLSDLESYFDESSSGSGSDIEDLMIQRRGSNSRKAEKNTGVPEGEDPPQEEFWTESARFKNLSAALILVNTMVIIIETCFIQLRLAVFDYINIAFTMSYACELLLCFREQGIRRFLCTDDVWNKFDFAVTVLSVSDLIVDDLFLSASADNISAASFSRLFRLLRILRVIRGLRFLNELDYVLVQVTRATLRLGLVVGIVLLTSSIIATQMLWDCSDDYVAGLFSDLGNSLWTLFRIMTLDDWSRIVEPVLQAKPEMRPFFTIFIFTTAISLISLAPAMFIDISLRRSQQDEQHAKERARARKRNEKRRLLMTLFKAADIFETGQISVESMKKVLTNNAILQELEESGITKAGDIRDVRLGLFDLSVATRETNKTEFTMEQLVAGVLEDQEDITQEVLWRSCTSTRLMLNDFASIVLDDLKEIREVLLHGYESSIGTSHVSSADPQWPEESCATGLSSWSHMRRSTKRMASKISALNKDTDHMRSHEKVSIDRLESNYESPFCSESGRGGATESHDGSMQRQVSAPTKPCLRSAMSVTFSDSDNVGELKSMRDAKSIIVQQADESSASVPLLSRSPIREMSDLVAGNTKTVFSTSGDTNRDATAGTTRNFAAVTKNNATTEKDKRVVFDARFGENRGGARQLVGTTIFRV